MTSFRHQKLFIYACLRNPRISPGNQSGMPKRLLIQRAAYLPKVPHSTQSPKCFHLHLQTLRRHVVIIPNMSRAFVSLFWWHLHACGCASVCVCVCVCVRASPFSKAHILAIYFYVNLHLVWRRRTGRWVLVVVADKFPTKCSQRK